MSETSHITSPIASQRSKNFPASRYFQVSWYVKHKYSSRCLPPWVQHKHIWTLEPLFILELFWPALEHIWNKSEVSTWQSAEKEKKLRFSWHFKTQHLWRCNSVSVSLSKTPCNSTVVLCRDAAWDLCFFCTQHCFTHSVKSGRGPQPWIHHPRQELTMNHSGARDAPVFNLVV